MTQTRTGRMWGTWHLAPCVLVLALGACATARPERPVVAVVDEAVPPEEEVAGWRAVVSAPDAEQIAALGEAWEAALGDARRAGYASRLREEGALLDPDAALPRAAPSPGSYRCRIVRMDGRGRRAYSAFEPYFCYVAAEGEQLSLTKQTGAERPGGYLWDDGRDRMIFLGAVALGEEDAPAAYGADAERDIVGVLERVEPFRYRVTMPSEGRLDVLELVPVVSPDLVERLAG